MSASPEFAIRQALESFLPPDWETTLAKPELVKDALAALSVLVARAETAEAERDEARDQLKKVEGELAGCREALRKIAALDTPIDAEDTKDFQAFLYHKAQEIARAALQPSDPPVGKAAGE